MTAVSSSRSKKDTFLPPNHEVLLAALIVPSAVVRSCLGRGSGWWELVDYRKESDALQYVMKLISDLSAMGALTKNKFVSSKLLECTSTAAAFPSKLSLL